MALLAGLGNQVPRSGKVRLAIEWTSEDDQHLLGVSLIVGRRAANLLARLFAKRAQRPDEAQGECALLIHLVNAIILFVTQSSRCGRVGRGSRRAVFSV